MANVLSGELASFHPQLLFNDIRQGLSAQQLHNFVINNKNEVADKMQEFVKKLLVTQEEYERIDIFLKIYDIIYEGLECMTKLNELLFLIELIGILALQKCRMPSPPSQLLRPLLNSLPNILRTSELINYIVNKVLTISSDIGDLTHLCKLFACLGHSWNTLTEHLCWSTLKRTLNSDDSPSEPSIPELQKLLSRKGPVKDIRVLAMTIRLIGMLIHRLSCKEFGKNVLESCNWIRKWLNTINNFDRMFSNLNPLDSIMLESLVTDITNGWPDILENRDEYENSIFLNNNIKF